MTASLDGALISLAILKANWEERGRSYLDNFVPFLLDCVREPSASGVTSQEVSDMLAERFGFRIPTDAIDSLVRRAVRLGYGRRQHHRFFPDKRKLPAVGLEGLRQRTLRRHEALTRKLREYLNARSVTLTDSEAERLVLEFIERHSVPLLRTVVTGSTPELEAAAEHIDYYIASFVLDVFESDPDGFSYLEDLVMGSMLATALHFSPSGEVAKRFDRHASLYLDTPVLLRALGYEGEKAQAAATETLDAAYELGASLRCFMRTADEIRGIWNASDPLTGVGEEMSTLISDRRPFRGLPASVVRVQARGRAGVPR